MQKKKLTILFLVGWLFLTVTGVHAQNVAVSPTPSPSDTEATSSAEQATPSGTIAEKVVEKKPDITEPEPEVKNKLERYLSENPVSPLSPTNFLQHAIRNAVKNGVPVNTIVLVLLFPIVVSLVAFARHVIGLSGFGELTPAIISIALLATGIAPGLILFFSILITATVSRLLITKLKLHYLPRMALVLWSVCLAVFGLLFASSLVNLKNLVVVSIFPILLMILLMEDFVNLQRKSSMKRAVYQTVKTLIIACICYFILNWEVLHKFVLVHPEGTVFGVMLFDYFLGRYTGLRILEYKRFRKLLNK